jgi:non-ribosomal peptide synthetase component E (peptide arylation enzyme)
VKVLLPGSDEEPVPSGHEGELCFRGPNTLRGYYNAPEINAVSFTRDGFFRSGDIVREEIIEGRTYYAFLGRLRDNISRGNEKFAAEEVENLIVRHPAVVDAKVVAMPDRYLGEKACAFIIPRPDQACPNVSELGAFLIGQGLAKYKLPERIETITAFPVTRVGKVDKGAMRAIIAEKVREEETQPRAARA